MARLIDADALGIGKAKREAFDNPAYADGWNSAIAIIEAAPTLDAVEVDALKAWLYEIALNNVDNPLSYACEEIISRLDGLRVFARERREGE